jgi:hypothetical protein
VAVAATDLRVVLAPGGSTFRAAAQASPGSQRLAASYGFGMQLDLSAHLAAYATSRQLLGQLRGSGWEVGLHYARNIHPHGRPLLARAGLGYLRQQLGYELGAFANPDPGLHLAGTPLAADQLTLTWQNQTAALLPKLGLGLELNRHWETTFDLGYVLALRTRSQLHIEEKKGFFSFSERAATLPLPAAEAQTLVNGQPAYLAPWALGRLALQVGVLYRLGQP